MPKLNILLNATCDVRAGYINVDPFAPDGDKDRIKGDPAALGPIVDAAEAEEIIALGILDYLPFGKVEEVVKHWISRLAHGGKLTVGTTDFLELSRLSHLRLISLDDFNRILHGEQREVWQFKKSSCSLNLLTELLVNNGLRILSKKLVGVDAVVIGERA